MALACFHGHLLPHYSPSFSCPLAVLVDMQQSISKSHALATPTQARPRCRNPGHYPRMRSLHCNQAYTVNSHHVEGNGGFPEGCLRCFGGVRDVRRPHRPLSAEGTFL